MTTIPDQAPTVAQPICVACVGDGTNPDGGACLRCRGTRIDPDPAAPSGMLEPPPFSRDLSGDLDAIPAHRIGGAR